MFRYETHGLNCIYMVSTVYIRTSEVARSATASTTRLSSSTHIYTNHILYEHIYTKRRTIILETHVIYCIYTKHIMLYTKGMVLYTNLRGGSIGDSLDNPPLQLRCHLHQVAGSTSHAPSAVDITRPLRLWGPPALQGYLAHKTPPPRRTLQ